MSIQELKKQYKLTEEQMEQIRNAMEIAYKSIQNDLPGRQSSFEHRMAKIVGAQEGNWHVAEEFAQTYFEAGKWTDVFLEFYGGDSKFKSYIEEWEKRYN